MRYFLPPKKEKLVVELLRQTIEKAREGEQMAALDLAKLLGKLNSMRRYHGPVLGVLSRTFQHLLGSRDESEGWHCKVLLTYEAVRELSMLLEKLTALNGQHIFTAESRTKVFELSETDRLTSKVKTTDEHVENLFVSDASDSHVFVFKADGRFQYVREFELSDTEKKESSGYRELLAVRKALEDDPAQFTEFAGGVIYWQTDSKNCYSFLTKGSRIPKIQDLVMDIKHRERKLDVRIVPVWTPRSQARIVEADLGSKLNSSTDEWCIDRQDLAEVFSALDYWPSLDCMATSRNSVCEKFFSKIRQIGSAGVNFLCQDLKSDCLYYCCPPVKLINKVVGHLLEKTGVTCLLIVPVWVQLSGSVCMQMKNFVKQLCESTGSNQSFLCRTGLSLCSVEILNLKWLLTY